MHRKTITITHEIDVSLIESERGNSLQVYLLQILWYPIDKQVFENSEPGILVFYL